MRWEFREPGILPGHTAHKLPPWLHNILSARSDLAGEPELEAFLRPRLASLSDPFLLPDMRPAVERLLAAIERREKIVLFGDYDVDGITSLAILSEVLRAYGAEVACFLPLRMDEGYGLSADGVERCLSEHNPRLLVAVDCGTTSHDTIEWANGRGVDVVVIDHHACRHGVPACHAVVNPMRDGRFSYLCTAGLAFKVSHALMKERRLEGFDLRDTLDLVAIGTIADLVPLVGENRILVKAGLERLASTLRPGLRALVEVCALAGKPTSRDVGFRIGPRLNAAGRLASAAESLDLLQTSDPRVAARLAASLDAHNRERQGVERQILQAAEEEIAKIYANGRLPAGLVLGRRDWHQGVIGIVASRLMRQYHRPSIVIGFGADGVGKGSGRSIDGLSMVEALGHCAEHLIQYGGHEKAAGLSISEQFLKPFAEAFCTYCERVLDEGALTPRLTIDAVVELGQVNERLLGEHDLLEPFGMGNPQPTLAVRGIVPASEPRVLKDKHLRFDFAANRRRVTGIFFQGVGKPLPRPPWDVAFTLERNTFRGITTPQMNIVAIQTTSH